MDSENLKIQIADIIKLNLELDIWGDEWSSASIEEKSLHKTTEELYKLFLNFKSINENKISTY